MHSFYVPTKIDEIMALLVFDASPKMIKIIEPILNLYAILHYLYLTNYKIGRAADKMTFSDEAANNCI